MHEADEGNSIPSWDWDDQTTHTPSDVPFADSSTNSYQIFEFSYDVYYMGRFDTIHGPDSRNGCEIKKHKSLKPGSYSHTTHAIAMKLLFFPFESVVYEENYSY
jgi:hypothetical protein